MPERPLPDLQDAAAPESGAATHTMRTLYAAAIGPVQLPRYLALFERFDRAGRAPAGWNAAASLVTLNWMVLHHLWTAALVYVALVEGLALLVFGVGRPLLQWPPAVEWGLLAAFALFAVALPGFFGDALLHGEVRKRIARALSLAPTIPDACDMLRRQASSRRRLLAILACNVLLALALGAAWVLVPEGGWSAQHRNPPVAAGAVPPAPAGAPGSASVAAAPPTTAATPTPAMQAPPVADATPTAPPPEAADAPDAVGALPSFGPPGLALSAVGAHPARAEDPGKGTATATAAATAAATAETHPPARADAPAPTPPGAQVSPVLPAPGPGGAPRALAAPETAPRRATPPAPPAETAIATVAPAAAPTVSPPARAAAPAAANPARPQSPARPSTASAATPAAVAAPAPPPPTARAKPALTAAPDAGSTEGAAPASASAATPGPGSAPGYYLNVGLFAEEANARRAQARLLNAGMPAFRQTFEASAGPRTRVRVGPFATADEAQRAAVQVRSLGLETLMYRQGG